MKLYPLKFKPILKPTIWGGDEITKLKHLPVQDGIGESWEISDVENHVSVVANGKLEGKNLTDLIRLYGADLLGKHNLEKYEGKFPLLIKFIDAKDDLSIQVHPNDELAKKRHNSFGKTEMWYVMAAAPGATLYSGFSKKITPEEYVERVKNNTFTDVLQLHEIKAGDVFYLPAGRVHAIRKNTLIAEIQQTSDITYRIYDYNRQDAQGHTRELHTELAKDAIDYSLYDNYRTAYKENMNVPVELVDSPYFHTHLLHLTKNLMRDFSGTDSFVIYICLSGTATLTDNNNESVTICQGETILLPATTESVSIECEKEVRLLEVVS